MPRATPAILSLFALAAALGAAAPATAQTAQPSRAAETGCAWERLSDATLGLAAWVERCDFGDRQIDLHVEGNAVVQHYSDGGDAEAVIQVFDLKDGEPPQAGLRRVFAEHTDPALAARCVAVEAADGEAVPAGVQRYQFVPDADYQAELTQAQVPDEVPEPPCGDFGLWPDGTQYFEVQAEARKILFVVTGQEAPLFDEQTLQLLTP